MITLDGSFGEGGGQILRTALGLSLVTGTPFQIDRIRANRKNPGLQKQHLMAVTAAKEIGTAEANGAFLGSKTLYFKPAAVTPGDYHFDIGSAGSATLVLQTVLPALLKAGKPSSLVLEGGTHNPMAPPFDFLAKAFLPLINEMGPRVEAKLDRRGFYPAGGGKLRVTIQPAPLKRLDRLERGKPGKHEVVAVVSRLNTGIAERELGVIREKLGLNRKQGTVEEDTTSRGPGNFVSIAIVSEHLTEVFCGFGERGVPAESVAAKAADEALEYLASTAAAGSHLADQLMIPMALAGGGSFTTLPLTPHSTTNLEVISRFLGTKSSATKQGDNAVRVEIW